MFTGLVDDVGLIEHVADTPAGRELRIASRYIDVTDGESIAVNGACLTVREHGMTAEGRGWFTVAAVVTTIGRTTIGSWQAGEQVNLERAMKLGDRLGGHLVLGHVDGLGRVLGTRDEGDAWLIDVELPESLRLLMVDKGSVAVNGVSLTVNELLPTGIQLSIIEYTRRHTALGVLAPGTPVHVEADVLAKHVERLLTPWLRASGAPSITAALQELQA
ncbi:riboflavin synthase [Gemmatimonas sp.]|jgi:riboflavin synthase|uniref:riboflavin synthase n=1 Tax=Gemmatimonas sp. TaxID=1962908 RepID=UPI0027BAE943|nr:riboflavin synthase [Gemmatimonas sp.]